MGKSRHQRDYEDQKDKLSREEERKRQRERKQQREKEDLEHADLIRNLLLQQVIINNS